MLQIFTFLSRHEWNVDLVKECVDMFQTSIFGHQQIGVKLHVADVFLEELKGFSQQV